MTPTLTESSVLQACRTLFGPEPDISRGFLFYLQPSGAKSAYRRKAKETHPDLFFDQDRDIRRKKTDLFRAILEAYETLNRFFKERDDGLWAQSDDRIPRTKRTHSGRTASARANTTRRDMAKDFYRGPMPFRTLEIGRYLYYAGYISYWELIEALTWQRKQRPVIGSVAERWGWLNGASIERITSSRSVPGRFGERAIHLGLLSSFQVKTILYYQRTLQERLGRYFVLHGLLSPEELESLAHKMIEHNAQVLATQKTAARRTYAFG